MTTRIFDEEERRLWDRSIALQALYESPVDAQGKHLGPLVPYSGKDTQGRNFVGWVYFNFAMIEPHVQCVDAFATLLYLKIVASGLLDLFDTIVGIPDGGRSLGEMLALHMSHCRFVYPAKVPRPKPANAVKEEYDLIFKRHPLKRGDQVLLVDDIHNNFQQTDNAIQNIADTGAEVVGLASGFNRSMTIDCTYVPKEGVYKGRKLWVVSSIRRALPEFEIDHLDVAEHYNRGFIEKDVKANWSRLKSIMDAAKEGCGGFCPQ